MIREDQLRPFDATKTAEAPFVRVTTPPAVPAVLPTVSPLRQLLLHMRRWQSSDSVERAIRMEKRVRAYNAMRISVDRTPR